MRLAGKTAVVTGAGSGIGRAIALRFAREGAAVVAVGQRQEPLAETVRGMASGLAVSADVSDGEQVRRVMAAAVERYGHLDVLVNGAAKNRPDTAVAETVAEMSEEWWTATLAVNVTGAFLCCKHALPHMIAAGGGAIVNIASTSGIAGNWNQGAYVASKHGLVGLTRSIALDYAARNVRANAICPGFIETGRSVRFSSLNRGEGWQEKKLAEIPLGRCGQPEDVASLAAFLVSDDAAYITGAVIPIDGGTAARRG